jgi:pilus assembly protein Flp/PilA
MFKFINKIGRDDRGATAVEYGLILSLIFLAMIGGVSAFGSESSGLWSFVSDTILGSTDHVGSSS